MGKRILGILAHTCNHIIQEIEAKTLLQIWGSPTLHNGTLFQRSKNKERVKHKRNYVLGRLTRRVCQYSEPSTSPRYMNKMPIICKLDFCAMKRRDYGKNEGTHIRLLSGMIRTISTQFFTFPDSVPCTLSLNVKIQ